VTVKAGGAAGPAGRGPAPAADRIMRVSADDLMQLAADAGPARMQVAAILVLAGGAKLELASVREAMAGRIEAVPRLRQRLTRTPFGCGRPVWGDDPAFDIRRHVREVRAAANGDERALLAAAAAAVTRRLPRDRPLWSATFVTGLAGGNAALIVAFHHVLADGIGGLAVLAELADGACGPPRPEFPRPGPSRLELFTDATARRLRALAHVPAGLRRLRGALAELRPGHAGRPPRCSLNRRTGPARALAVARADLAAVRETAHAHGATVNDVVLAAVTGALHGLLCRRGEPASSVVISIPVSPRRQAAAARLGNQVGVIPAELPITGGPARRLEEIAAVTRARKRADRGASAALLVPAFRALAGLGLLQWLTSHQRLVTTFVTNVRGPDARLSFLGVPIADVVAVSAIAGNVTVAFAALSYAGTLDVTVIADPDRCPDLLELADGLQRELDALTREMDT
jgi:diacylglycerol O-acyltransferase / wax synthase